MSFITNMRLAFTEGFHDTARAVRRRWKETGDHLQDDAKAMAADARDMDRLARQEDNFFAWAGLKSLSTIYGVGSTAVRGVTGLTYGAPDFMATVASRLQGTPSLVWGGMQHCSAEAAAGAKSFAHGDFAQGFTHFLDGTSQAWMMIAGGRGMVRGFARHAPVAYQTFADGVNAMLAAGKVATPNTPINLWARGYERGVFVIDARIVTALEPAELKRGLRQGSVTNDELRVAAQESDVKLAAVARQALDERTNLTPEGYMPIPGGKFNGQALSPFAMKITPVTNGEWLLGVDGKLRFVQLVEDPVTKVIRVEAVMAKPPSSVNPKINFDAGEVAVEGSKILVKLVDQPSLVYDASGCVFSRANQPVVGVNYYHSQAWVLTDASGRLLLPTNLMQEAVASKYGAQKFGTATGKLYGADGRKLGHFDEWNNGEGTTADVNDPRYPAGPYGVHSQFNVWRWRRANPHKPEHYGLYGASWRNYTPEDMRADHSVSLDFPVHRNYDVGFQPILLQNSPH